ncbi:MAG: amidohydrolase, partial [Candidatus Eremiobacteraeota bacterium]|nr:amidohydrolase [Candidatus Eremiobacteraeota bacterium]
MKKAFVVLFLSLCFVIPTLAEEADLLITGGVVVTMDKERHIYSPGMVLAKDGVIVEVGPVRPNAGAKRVIDASGKAVVPGLVNAHTHLPMVLFRGLADDLELNAWLRETIFPAEAANVTADFVAAGTRLGLAELIQGGVTTYADMYYFEETVAAETRKAGVRAVLGQTMLDFPAPDFKSWPEMTAAIRRFQENWGQDSLITPALAPHAPYTVGPEHWREVAALAEELDMPVLTHLAEAPLEVEHTLREYSRRPVPFLDEQGVLTKRLTGAHVIYVDDSEMKLLAERSVGAAHCPESNMKVAVGVSPVPDLLKAGVRVGLGTDGAASNNDLDMWQEMDTAAKLHKNERRDPTVMPAESAFALATIGGAQALHMENEIGSLEVGKAADLALVDLDQTRLTPLYNNIYSLLVYAVRAGDVTHTVVGGRVLMENRRLLTLDETAIKSEVAEYRKRVLRSLNLTSQ